MRCVTVSACVCGCVGDVQVGNWVSQWANDLLIWENKVHLKKPLLVRGDGPVTRLRRWYYQFYACGEPKIALTSLPVQENATVAASAATTATTAASSLPTSDAHACPAAGAVDW